MHSRSLVAGALAASLLTPDLSAQGTFDVGVGSGAPGSGKGYALDLTPNPIEPYSRVVTGDVFGDGLRDVFMLSGTEVHGRFSIGLYDAEMLDAFPGGVNDFDLAQDDDGREALFAVDSTGVISNRWDRSSTNWGWDPRTEFTGSNWLDAEFVRAWPLGAGRRPLLYGVMAGGTEVRALLPVTGGFADVAVFSTSDPIVGFEDIQFDGAGLPELAILTNTGLGVYSGAWSGNSGLPIESIAFPAGSAAGSLVTGRSNTVGSAWAACFHGSPSQPTANLAVLEQGGNTVALAFGATTPETPSVPFQAGSMVAADLDGDSETDILITNKADLSFVALLNDGGGAPIFVWTAARARRLGITGLMSSFGDDAMYAVDFDNDGDSDYGVGISQDRRQIVVKSNTVEHDLRAPALERDSTPGADEVVVDHLHQATFRVLAPQVVIPSATHIEVKMWHKPSLNAPLDPGVVDSALIPIADADVVFELTPSIPSSPLGGLDVPTFDEIYFVTMRLVEMDNGDRVAVFPAQVIGFEGLNVGQGNPNRLYLSEEWVGTSGDLFEVELVAREAAGPGDGGGVGDGNGSGGQCLPGGGGDPPNEDSGGD